MKCAIQFVLIFFLFCDTAARAQSSSVERIAVPDYALIDLKFDQNPGNELPSAPQTTALSAAIEGTKGNYTVKLSWDASTSENVVGYNVYRGKTADGPFDKLNSSLHKETSYTDGQVNDGETYYYVTTAVNATGQESGYSNQAEAAIP
jgi:hypothetical protein